MSRVREDYFYFAARRIRITTKLIGKVTWLRDMGSELLRDLSDDEALSLITINPAQQLGIDTKVGSIEIGKDADLAIYSNHPLSIYAIPQVTIVDGIVRFDVAHDPADMRLYIDPEEITPTYYGQEGVEGCMRDTKFMFSTHY